MKTFYSILYSVIRPETDEKISIGLIISDGNASLFNYSKQKLWAVRRFLGTDEFRFIKNYITSLNRMINESLKNKDQQNIYEIIGDKHAVINESYFNYLSTYNQNLIWFSKPIQIDIPVNNQVFDMLFQKLIDQEYFHQLIKSELQSVVEVKRSFIPNVSEYFSSEKEITNDDFNGIVIPVTIDLIGKNERLVFAQFIELERNINYIKNDYYDLKQLKEVQPDSSGFLISSEPKKEKFVRQHQIWEQIRKSNHFSYLDTSEVQKIKEYAATHGVLPYVN